MIIYYRILSAFQNTGIWPFDFTVFDEEFTQAFILSEIPAHKANSLANQETGKQIDIRLGKEDTAIKVGMSTSFMKVVYQKVSAHILYQYWRKKLRCHKKRKEVRKVNPEFLLLYWKRLNWCWNWGKVKETNNFVLEYCLKISNQKEDFMKKNKNY